MTCVTGTWLIITRINANTRKAVFWPIVYLVRNPPLMEEIRKEVEPAFGSEQPDQETLMNNCPTLISAWLGMLRLTNSAESIKHVQSTMIIGGKQIEEDSFVLVPLRQIHFDKGLFGENSADFDGFRFRDKPKLQHSKGWWPFGGGTSMCPGRLIAKSSAVTFVAVILHGFDIREAERQPMPQIDTSSPSLGISPPRVGADFVVTVERKYKH